MNDLSSGSRQRIFRFHYAGKVRPVSNKGIIVKVKSLSKMLSEAKSSYVLSRNVSTYTLLSPRLPTYRTSLTTKTDTAVEPSLRGGLLKE